MITADIQKLEAGEKIRLVIVDGEAFGAGVMRFHNHTIPHTAAEIAAAGGDENRLPAKSLWFGGEEFGAWPFQVEGLATNSDANAEPVLTVANISGRITALCLRFDDMAQAKITIIDTFSQYLDSGASPDASQCYKQVWYIDSKTSEDGENVAFKLASPMDLQGVLLPRRQITAICTWACWGMYRSGDGCDYSGAAMFDKMGNPTDDPARDQCGGLLSDCKKRCGSSAPLPFGGFPGASLVRK